MSEPQVGTTQAGRTPAGEALVDVVVELARAFFKMRAAGQRIGAVTASRGGLWGLLRSLKAEGPQTVPQIARARPVARQHIQKLANEMAADGLVAFIDNPAHKRSKLLRLTPRGEARYGELSERLRDLCERMALDIGEEDLRITASVLRRLSEKMERP